MCACDKHRTPYCLFLVFAVLGYGVARERPFYCKKELNNGLFSNFLRENFDITKSISTFAMCYKKGTQH